MFYFEFLVGSIGYSLATFVTNRVCPPERRVHIGFLMGFLMGAWAFYPKG